MPITKRLFAIIAKRSFYVLKFDRLLARNIGFTFEAKQAMFWGWLKPSALSFLRKTVRLSAVIQDRNRSQKHVQRARKRSVLDVARLSGVSRPAVWRWKLNLLNESMH